MSHSCPDCGMTCYCNGDIDDCLFDFEEDVIACTHCDCKVCGQMRENCQCEPAYDEEE